MYQQCETRMQVPTVVCNDAIQYTLLLLPRNHNDRDKRVTSQQLLE